jgi:Rrf2 family protein
MLQVSRKFEYGMHAVTYLAMKGNNQVVTVKEMAGDIGFSQVFLAKAMQNLKKAGIAKSVQGVKGGYMLGRSPEEITVADISLAIEGRPHLVRCAVENCDCEIMEYCNHRSYMQTLEDQIQELMAGMTIAVLLQRKP